MKKNLCALCAAMLTAVQPSVMSAGPVKPSEDPPRVIEIRALYQEVVKNRDRGLMVCDRYEHNTGKLVLPGTGSMTCRVSVWRYDDHLWRNAEKGPAPKSWIAQAAISRGEGPEESYEFLFDDSNSVVFFCQSAPRSAERRYYFTGEKPVRVVEGNTVIDRITAEHTYYAEAVIMRAAFEIKRGLMPEIDMR